MKIVLSIATFVALFSLIGCGGGSDTGGGTEAPTSTVLTPSTSSSNDLIIDNGRGTLNNQDTESAPN